MVQDYERLLGRKDTAQYLTSGGFKTAPATLAKPPEEPRDHCRRKALLQGKKSYSMRQLFPLGIK
jgi:hypothetical protein